MKDYKYIAEVLLVCIPNSCTYFCTHTHKQKHHSIYKNEYILHYVHIIFHNYNEITIKTAMYQYRQWNMKTVTNVCINSSKKQKKNQHEVIMHEFSINLLHLVHCLSVNL